MVNGEKKRIIHVFPYEKFARDYINFVNHFFHKSEHLFIIYWKYDKPDLQLDWAENVYYINHQMDLFFQKRNRKLVKAILKSKQIIFHSLNETTDKISILLPGVCSKSYICFWGYDIYGFRNKVNGWKARFWRWYRKQFVRHAKGILTLVEGDYDVLNSFVKTKGKHLKGFYLPYDFIETLNKARKEKRKNPLWLLVGNSASRSNQHYEILKQLSVYKDEDIKILVPLSYGDMDYAEEIVQYGCQIFGDKFVPVQDFMKAEEYWGMLSQCTAAFFNNDRQQALGNINALLYFGTKVYIRTDTAMWSELSEARKWILFDIEKVGEIAFKELLDFKEEDMEYNYKLLDEYFNPDYNKQIWERIFVQELERGKHE